jgi:hypothetical protein
MHGAIVDRFCGKQTITQWKVRKKRYLTYNTVSLGVEKCGAIPGTGLAPMLLGI